MSQSSHEWYQHYQPWRRQAEIGFWVLVYGLSAVFNSATGVMDVQRRGADFAAWEPVVWESSSALVLLLLVPALIWFMRRFPLQWQGWTRLLAIWLAASLIYSLIHVGAMVSLRHLAYWVMGSQYSFGDWPRELTYEYMKDFRTFLSNIAVIELYRFALRRMHGEARLLDAPDSKPKSDAVRQPERFLVKMLGREFLVPTRKIEWAQAAGNYVNLRVGEREYPLRSTLSGLASRLDSGQFIQVHRSWLVNISQVAAIEPQPSGDAQLRMHGGGVIPCSRRYREVLKEKVGN